MRRSPTPQQGDFATQQAAGATEALRRQLAGVPFLTGVRVANVTIPGSSTKAIYHNLGRLPAGWIVLRIRGHFAELRETAADERTLTIEQQHGTDTVVDLWIF